MVFNAKRIVHALTNILDHFTFQLSGTPHEKKSACGALGHLLFLSNKALPILKTLYNRGALKRLLELVLDTDVSIGIAAVGTLRNCSLASGPDGCKYLLQSNALTILTGIFTNVSAEIITVFYNISPTVVTPGHSL